MPDARVDALLAEVGLPAAPTTTITGGDPYLRTPYPIGDAAATVLAACASGAARIWEDETGRAQDVRVDVRAAAASLVSFLLQRVDNPPALARRLSPTTALYQAGDGRWIHLHGGFPHLAAGTVKLLGCVDEAPAIAEAVGRWDAADLEEALAAAGLCGAMVRGLEEWLAHPQAAAIAPLGRVSITKLADGEPRRAGDGQRPLGAVRVLDLTRLLAGPSAGRTLAEHGAEVLLINSARLDNPGPFVVDTGHGKRSAFLELDEPADLAVLHDLAAGADVFVQNYRADSLARRGLASEALIAEHPGLVYVTVNCYGDVGPWRSRPGWEQMAESATGLVSGHSNGLAKPELVPAAPCDYITGYLAALGAIAALRRRAVEGGSYLVRASLCQTGMWLASLGTVCDRSQATGMARWDDLALDTETAWGTLHHLAPVALLSETPARWASPPVPLGTHPAAWAS